MPAKSPVEEALKSTFMVELVNEAMRNLSEVPTLLGKKDYVKAATKIGWAMDKLKHAFEMGKSLM